MRARIFFWPHHGTTGRLSPFNQRPQVYGEDFEGMYPSVGACDEFIRLFLFRKVMGEEEILNLEGTLGGGVSWFTKDKDA